MEKQEVWKKKIFKILKISKLKISNIRKNSKKDLKKNFSNKNIISFIKIVRKLDENKFF